MFGLVCVGGGGVFGCLDLCSGCLDLYLGVWICILDVWTCIWVSGPVFWPCIWMSGLPGLIETLVAG